MSDLLESVRAAVKDRYEVVREIGHGGMAAVFLARDLRAGRQVALKVMLPELARMIGSDRFALEISIIARLSHPHVLPLIESGEADGVLYYTMPFVEGESLRDRLNRETQLSIPDAVRITIEVASALDHAHKAGFIHRDVKPENILLSSGRALVADFGIARVVTELSGEKLTATGMSLGTPAYMAPEQWGDQKRIDGRVDIYALGCVLYEMLSGGAPFSGVSAAAIMARHSLDPVPAVRTVRPSVPDWLESVIHRALAKVPADRFVNGAELIDALENPAAVSPPPARQASRRKAIAAGILAVVGLLAGAALVGGRERSADATLVAVMPFRVSGAVDTSLVTPAGVASLLFSRLTGEGALRAVDPGSITDALRREDVRGAEPSQAQAEAVARRVGAGLLLSGQLFGTGDRVTVNARLTSPSGRELVRVPDRQAPSDSILPLLDRVAVELLAAAAYPGRRLEELSSMSLSTIRPYLAGLSMYRQGRYRDAVRRFEEAQQSDSTAPQPAMMLAWVYTFMNDPHSSALVPALERAWRHRDRLSARDRRVLEAFLGEQYPRQPSLIQSLSDWTRVRVAAPEVWEASSQLGDLFLHWGPMLGIPGSVDSAGRELRGALEVDSLFAPALEQMIEVAALRNDRAQVARLSRRYLSAHPTADLADYVRWRAGLVLRDDQSVRRTRERFAELSPSVLRLILGRAQLAGTGLDDASRAAGQLAERAGTPVDNLIAAWLSRELAINTGRRSGLPAASDERLLRLPFTPLFRVVEALYWDGDSVLADSLVRQRAPAASAAMRARTPPSDAAGFDVCSVTLWRLARGVAEGAEDAVRALRSRRDALDLSQSTFIAYCAATLDALIAARRGRGDAKEALERLDSLIVQGHPTNGYIMVAANLTSSRLWEARGDVARALAAVRRRPWFHESRGTAGFSSYLREEGRLAALAGDRDGATRAYRLYLALRAQADSSLAGQVSQVRRSLDSLQ